MFNLARGFSTLTSAPPFSFERVLLNIFPLRADFSTLEAFLDSALNIAPEFARFRPAMPFVMLIVAHYPKMSLENRSLGWVSSNEITFAIPVEWYEPGKGRWVLKDFAQFSPYIFVDSDASQIEGRQVYGWPKMQGWLARTQDEWMEDPRRARTLLRMDSYAFAAGTDKISELLSIRQNAPLSLTVMPPELDGPLNLAGSISDATQGWVGVMRAWSEWATRNAATISNPSAMTELLNGAGETLRSFTGKLQANTINLKQFRDCGAPGLACYQAITNANMDVEQVRRLGLLGDQAVFRGDVSGGYEVKLNSYRSLPIVESLGLLGERNTYNGVASTTLKPVLPFWQELDLKYGEARNIVWRAGLLDHGRWRSAGKEQKDRPVAPRSASEEQVVEAGPVPYNTAGSSGYQVAEGPFEFSEAVVIVLPLLASRQRLAELLTRGPDIHPLTGETLDASEREQWAMFGQLPDEIAEIEPWGEYVYLVIKHLPEVSSSLDTLGVWSSSLVEFAIPVRRFRNTERGREFVSCGYVSPFMYTNSDVGANTARELNGWPSLGSAIESLPNTWLTREGPFPESRPILKLSTSMPAEFNDNERYQWLPLIELQAGNTVARNDLESWRAIAGGWGEEVKQSAQSMYSKRAVSDTTFDDFQSLAANLFDGDALNQFSLKQFRDAEDSERACYQALVSTSIKVGKVWDLREIEEPLHLNVYQRPTQAIVETLGLRIKSQSRHGPGIVDSLQPVRPFYFKADIQIDNGDKICWRAGGNEWSEAPEERAVREAQGTLGASQDHGLEAPGHEFIRSIRWSTQGKSLDKCKPPQQIAAARRAWLSKNRGLTRREVKELLSGALEPQMAIDGILSDEWEHAGLPRWYRELDLGLQIQALKKRRKKLRKKRRRGKSKPHHEREIEAIRLWLKAMQGFPISQLPPFSLRCDSVGTEEGWTFPFLERQPGEFDPQYWSPQLKGKEPRNPVAQVPEDND